MIHTLYMPCLWTAQTVCNAFVSCYIFWYLFLSAVCLFISCILHFRCFFHVKHLIFTWSLPSLPILMSTTLLSLQETVIFVFLFCADIYLKSHEGHMCAKCFCFYLWKPIIFQTFISSLEVLKSDYLPVFLLQFPFSYLVELFSFYFYHCYVIKASQELYLFCFCFLMF